ncbi:HAD domain-containing protein [Ferrovibrio sp.]|uniref:HAD domain-containing protein n=1 Tax=Ferrovibrio sp. TaxID=1917215 RepID=UPI003515F1CF
MNVIFLDFDGPLITHRSQYFIPKRSAAEVEYLIDLPEPIDLDGLDIDLAKTRIPAFDPIAVSLLQKLVFGHLAQIVVSSSWRKIGKSNIEAILEVNGIPPCLHHRKWSTDFIGLTATRSAEILTWLQQAGERGEEVTSYAAIDDDPNILNLPGGILVPYVDGLRWSDFCSASAALGGGIVVNGFDLVDGEFVADVSTGALGEKPIERLGNTPARYNFGPISMDPSEAPIGCVRCVKSAYQLVRIAKSEDMRQERWKH